jgi:hypothetical protein
MMRQTAETGRWRQLASAPDSDLGKRCAAEEEVTGSNPTGAPAYPFRCRLAAERRCFTGEEELKVA